MNEFDRPPESQDKIEKNELDDFNEDDFDDDFDDDFEDETEEERREFEALHEGDFTKPQDFGGDDDDELGEEEADA